MFLNCKNGLCFFSKVIISIIFFLSVFQSVFSQGPIKVERSILKHGEGFIVNISIKSKGVRSFAKVVEFIPELYKVKNGETGGGVFSLEENKVKFVWISFPSDSVNLSYFISPAQNNFIPENIAIKGEFSFIQNNEKYSVPILTSDFFKD